VTDVAARDNGVVIVLSGECAGVCAVSYDAVVAWCIREGKPLENMFYGNNIKKLEQFR
jgi:hypothetical protein